MLTVETKIRKCLVVLICLSLIPCIVMGQRFQKTFGDSETEFGNGIHITGDGGYAIGGLTNSFNTREIVFLKTNKKGDRELFRRYADPDGVKLGLRDLEQTSDGGYILGGRRVPDKVDKHMIKIGGDGTVDFGRWFGGTDYDITGSIIQCSAHLV